MVQPAEQRHNMVESQIRPSEITDRRIIRAMQLVPRELFLPEPLRPVAYLDRALDLPVGAGEPPRSELAPRVLAKLLQAANINVGDVVLDVGAATAYSSALIAHLCETVLALEENSSLSKRAGDTVAKLAIDNVAIVKGPLAAGYQKAGPYDVIIVEGAVADLPGELAAQLKEKGRLVAIVQTGSAGQVCCWSRIGDTISKQIIFDATARYLPGFEPKPVFSF